MSIQKKYMEKVSGAVKPPGTFSMEDVRIGPPLSAYGNAGLQPALRKTQARISLRMKAM